jgi:tRNA (guanine-N7-)-methyltransferase
MGRALKYDFAGPDFRVAPEDLAGPGLAKLFAPDLEPPLRLTVDLGFGRGELLLDLARAQPGAAFLGVEYSFKRVLKLARRLARTPLRNVRLVGASAEAIVGDRLADGSVRDFWINFPDPWPKKRHHRRRLIQPEFVHRLAGRLEPGGTLHVATDHEDYAEAIAGVLGAEPLLENAYAPDAWRAAAPARSATAYELEWRAQGRACRYFAYRRVEAPCCTATT